MNEKLPHLIAPAPPLSERWAMERRRGQSRRPPPPPEIVRQEKVNEIPPLQRVYPCAKPIGIRTGDLPSPEKRRVPHQEKSLRSDSRESNTSERKMEVSIRREVEEAPIVPVTFRAAPRFSQIPSLPSPKFERMSVLHYQSCRGPSLTNVISAERKRFAEPPMCAPDAARKLFSYSMNQEIRSEKKVVSRIATS